jgi:hypothetical protein
MDQASETPTEAPRAADGLILGPPFYASRKRVNPHNGGVHNQILEIGIVLQRRKDTLADAAFAPCDPRRRRRRGSARGQMQELPTRGSFITMSAPLFRLKHRARNGDYGTSVVVTDYQNSIRSLAMCTTPEKCFFTASAHGA